MYMQQLQRYVVYRINTDYVDNGTFSEVIYGGILNPFESQTNASVNTCKGRAPTPTCVS